MDRSDQTPYDIYIVGLGNVGNRQITRETEEVLKKTGKVFLLYYQEVMHKFIENQLNTPVTDLRSEYAEGKNRAHTYHNIRNRVINEALECDTSVTLGVYGHPTLFVSPTRLIQEEAPDRGLKVKVLPGVSSIDCMFADIGFDPAYRGVQMYEATDFLLKSYNIDPAVPLFLWQIGSLETGLYSKRKSKPKRFVRLRKRLQEFYPKDHLVYLLRTATYPFTNSEQHAFQLNNFEKQHHYISSIHTLYVPPGEKKPISDNKLANKMDSKEYLSEIVE